MHSSGSDDFYNIDKNFEDDKISKAKGGATEREEEGKYKDQGVRVNDIQLDFPSAMKRKIRDADENVSCILPSRQASMFP